MDLSSPDQPAGLPSLPFHLTARPWTPLKPTADEWFAAIEGLCWFSVKHQDAGGAIIDPFLQREHQYSTPYFAFAVGALIHAGKAPDLLDAGVRAMDHATACFGKGLQSIPDGHAEFFDASLPGAIELYEGHVPTDKITLWKSRLGLPAGDLIHGPQFNWRTYAMKGEWLRARLGTISAANAQAFIEETWQKTQRKLIQPDKWNLYEDHQTDPDSLAVEAVGRGNLLALIAEGYNGPSAAEIAACAERGTATTLLLQSPDGQCPPNGRTDDHVFNDVLYQLGFEVMAARSHAAGNDALAGQYHRAAALSFRSIGRWLRSDGDWAGSYYITKNHFDPTQRIGYQPASNYGNYSGAVMMHLAEAALAFPPGVVEQPAPTEIGGYAITLDPAFSSVTVNAGGMQMQINIKGDIARKFEHYWTPLGVVRFARTGWDSRLGPSDGERDTQGVGVSFAPTWNQGGSWEHLASHPENYRGEFKAQFVHPLLIRCSVDYRPLQNTGACSHQDFIVTPDGVFSSVTQPNADVSSPLGITCPLLEKDGRQLVTAFTPTTVTTAYTANGDQQCFLALGPGASLTPIDDRVQSSYGWLRAVRSTPQVFVYPRSPGDPSAEDVQMNFKITHDGFICPLCIVHGNLYVGRTSAGGFGSNIDLTNDGQPDAVFGEACNFIFQRRDGHLTAVEVDRDTTVQIHGKTVPLRAYTPVHL